MGEEAAPVRENLPIPGIDLSLLREQTCQPRYLHLVLFDLEEALRLRKKFSSED